MTVLTRVSLQENVWSFLLGSRKAGFHCTEKQSVTHKNRNLINKKEFHVKKTVLKISFWLKLSRTCVLIQIVQYTKVKRGLLLIFVLLV